MKKELFGITREDVSDKNSYTLEYYLVENNILCEGAVHKTYGVEIRKLIPFADKTIEETSIVGDISVQRIKAEQFIRLLTDCKVTPIHLKDIAVDFLQSGEDSKCILCSA